MSEEIETITDQLDTCSLDNKNSEQPVSEQASLHASINYSKCFEHVMDFVAELSKAFPEEKSIAYYLMLLENTPFGKKKAIEMQVAIFAGWIKRERENICNGDLTIVEKEIIKFSDKCYIPIKKIFTESDPEVRNIIIQHLKVIGFATLGEREFTKHLFDKPRIDLKNTPLMSMLGMEDGIMSEFITDIQNSIDPTKVTNPLEAGISLLQSGIYEKMLGKFSKLESENKLDLNKMSQGVNNVLNSLGQDPHMKSQIDSMMGLMTSTLGPLMSMGTFGQNQTQEDMDKLE